MKMLRLTLVCSLLLLAATPSFAALCRSCDLENYPACVRTPGSASRCETGEGYCITHPSSICTGFTPDSEAAPALAEWTVASIEVTRPDGGTEVVTPRTAVAVADLSHSAPHN